VYEDQDYLWKAKGDNKVKTQVQEHIENCTKNKVPYSEPNLYFQIFTNKFINRKEFPDYHILICEDDLDMQIRILNLMRELFDPQGKVQISCVSGARQAKGVIESTNVNLIILDHDMPYGSGDELLVYIHKYMKENILMTKKNVPVITFSGISENNDRLFRLGAKYKFTKNEVLKGKANDIILKETIK